MYNISLFIATMPKWIRMNETLWNSTYDLWIHIFSEISETIDINYTFLESRIIIDYTNCANC